MKKNIISILSLICILGTAFHVNAQSYKKAEWNKTIMDSKYDTPKDNNGKIINSVTNSIISKYKPSVDSLLKVIGHSPRAIIKKTPESPLSNFAADVIKIYGEKYFKEKGINKKIDLSITNFGGIRASLPAGDITIYDVMSVFPFENKIVILEIQGKYIRGIIENFANKQKVEAMSGIKLIIKDKKIKKLLIGDKPIKDNKIYHLATIDFLLGGGDGLYLLKKRESVINTDILIRDAVIQYIQELTDKGESLNPKKDGRVILIKSKE